MRVLPLQAFPALALVVCAVFSAPAQSVSVLDHLMPYRDFYAESVEPECSADDGEVVGVDEPLESTYCDLSLATRVTIEQLKNQSYDETIDLDEVAGAIREMLNTGQDVNPLVERLPAFVRRRLPDLLQSSTCQFEQSAGYLQIAFEGENEGAGAPPYEYLTELQVICKQPVQYRLVLASMGDEIQSIARSTHYTQATVDVSLIAGANVWPAKVSFMNEGMLLSDRVFDSAGGIETIALSALLHADGDRHHAPEGYGSVTGLPANARLIIYELD